MGPPSTLPHALAGPEERNPYKRPRIMNTPPDDDLCPPPTRSARAEPDLISGNEAAITASWERLLRQLREEVKVVTGAGSDIIPTIDFEDLSDPQRAGPFLRDLATRGTAVVRGVVPADDAASWGRALARYLADNPRAGASPPGDGVCWSPAQLGARAHPNALAAQRFLMGRCWHAGGRGHGPGARMSTRHPVAYADRACVSSSGGGGSSPPRARARAGEADEAAAYRAIWAGRWEEHDPWDGAARLGEGGGGGEGEGEGEGGVLRMFEGALPLGVDPAAPAAIRACPLPLRLATAYRLLRPLFAPKRSPPPPPPPKQQQQQQGGPGAVGEGFLSPSNWALVDAARRTRVRGEKGRQEDLGDASHPHLCLGETLVPLPRLAPGDYVVWHPDAIVCSSTTMTTATTLLSLPACPLTRASALFLARQRRAFLLGFPGPDFAATTTNRAHVALLGSASFGESGHLGRPGTQDIYEVGGVEALRAMGLLAWEEEEGEEGELVEMANRILFPDRTERPKGG